MHDTLVAGLSKEEFPFVRLPSTEEHGSRINKAKANAVAQGQRLIVFVMGGVTYSETRSMHEVRPWLAALTDAGAAAAAPELLRRCHGDADAVARLLGAPQVAKATNKQVILGSTAMLTPSSYLLALRQMKVDAPSKV